MAYRELELTLLSAHDLKNVNMITRMEVYAVVSISGDPLTRQCTAPDPYGGRNPCWNATLRFAVPPTAEAAGGGSLHVLLRAERVLGDRDVGEVIVPLADLLAGAPAPGPQQQPQVAAYQVRKVHRWEPRGVLNVSYRLGPVVAPVAAAEAGPEKKPPPPVVMAYPAAGVPVASQAFVRPPADPYSPPPRGSGAARAAGEYDEKTVAPRNGKNDGGGLGRDREGPTQVCVGPHTQIILGGPPTSAGGGSNASSPRQKPDGAWPRQQHHHDDGGAYYYSSAQTAESIIGPTGGKEDRSRPKVLSQHDTQAHHQRVTSPPSSSSSASPGSSAHSSTPCPRALGHTNPSRSSLSTHRAATASGLSSLPTGG